MSEAEVIRKRIIRKVAARIEDLRKRAEGTYDSTCTPWADGMDEVLRLIQDNGITDEHDWHHLGPFMDMEVFGCKRCVALVRHGHTNDLELHGCPGK